VFVKTAMCANACHPFHQAQYGTYEQLQCILFLVWLVLLFVSSFPFLVENPRFGFPVSFCHSMAVLFRQLEFELSETDVTDASQSAS